MNNNQEIIELNKIAASKIDEVFELKKEMQDLKSALGLLQAECVNRDSSVCDSDAFVESRILLTKMSEE